MALSGVSSSYTVGNSLISGTGMSDRKLEVCCWRQWPEFLEYDKEAEGCLDRNKSQTSSVLVWNSVGLGAITMSKTSGLMQERYLWANSFICRHIITVCRMKYKNNLIAVIYGHNIFLVFTPTHTIMTMHFPLSASSVILFKIPPSSKTAGWIWSLIIYCTVWVFTACFCPQYEVHK